VNYLRQIERGLDYIEANLDADLDPGVVADHAGISRWYFQRIFKSLTGETLKTYIRSRRFAVALELLDSTDRSVLDVALASGFETHESFTRAFKKAFAVTPTDYRKSRRIVPFSRKARFDESYLRHIHSNVSLQPTLYQQRKLRLVGMTTQFFGADSDKSNFVRKLPALWDAFIPRIRELNRVDDGVAYGVIRPTLEGTDELEYLAAVEVNAAALVPPAMSLLELPSAHYAKFAHRGPVSALDRTLNYVYSSWLLTSAMQHTYGYDLEIYDARYVPNAEESLIHYAIPVMETDTVGLTT
jgi:AraC family transcriptional regulator